MLFSPLTWWKRDTARHSFFFANFLVGLPFTVFNTYILYQIQVTGFVIGHDQDEQPCTGTYCIVPFGGSEIDLNTAILYLNALGYAVGGILTIVITAYADYWNRKHLIITFFIVSYGALSVPSYWLRGPSKHTLVCLMGLYVGFFVITLIIIALLNIYIPHCMREMGKEAETSGNLANETEIRTKRRRYGFSMTVFGSINSIIGGVFMLVITIILATTLDNDSAQSSGLLVTTIVGFLTIAGAAVAFLGLPAIPSKPGSDTTKGWSGPLVKLLSPFRDMLRYKNLSTMLIAYTIYTDASFALSSITAQLYVVEIHPGTLEYSLYSLAQNLFQIGCLTAFLAAFHFLRIRLHDWLLAGYLLIIIIPAWGMIGLSKANFGFKNRWEFYVQNLLCNISSAIVNTSFRVLFSELIPRGSEVQWVGMQVVLWSATSWVDYIASGPLQNRTHQLRFPLLLCLVFLCIPPVLEILRYRLLVPGSEKRQQATQDATTLGVVGDQVITPLTVRAEGLVKV